MLAQLLALLALTASTLASPAIIPRSTQVRRKKKKFPVGAIVGIVIGVIIIAAIVLVALFILKRRKAKTNQLTGAPSGGFNNTSAPANTQYNPGAAPMSSNTGPQPAYGSNQAPQSGYAPPAGPPPGAAQGHYNN